MSSSAFSDTSGKEIAVERARVEADAAALVGERILGVRYADITNYDPEPRVWDHGDWHHATMAVELSLSASTVNVTWNDTFDAWGVEIFDGPWRESQKPFDPDDWVATEPDVWSVTDHPLWRERIAGTILGATFEWSSSSFTGSDGQEIFFTPCPEVLRLDFKAGPVWIVAAMPKSPDFDAVSARLGGDELMIVFTADVMRTLGLADATFLAGPLTKE